MKVKKRSVKTSLELIDDDMVVGLGGGETIGYFVEYLSHSHKDVKVVTPLFAAEQACIRAGLELLPLWSVNRVDLSFGGCDEVDQNINALNKFKKMAVISLMMHAKQPKRGLIACENGYIEIYNYPRGDQAVITCSSDGHSENKNGETKAALFYKIEDMEDYVSNKYSKTLDNTSNVMKILTKIRKQWGMIYPFE